MIQSSYKPIELPKASAPERAQSSKPRDLEPSKREKEEFKSQLKSVTDSDEPKVKAVKVSADKELRKPSSIIKEESETQDPDSVSPKVFDPSMTKDVQNLFGPETTEVEMTEEMIQQLAQGEVAEGDVAVDADLVAELKAKLAKGDRSPAIDFAEGEVDPELMKMEDFVAQKNMVNKKIVPQNVYGMNPQANKIALENGLKESQIVKDVTATESGAQPMNSQQFILNMQAEQKPAGNVNEVHAPVKTFDMSQIKTQNPDKIMNQITDYIVQAKAAKEPTVTMRVNHEQLGMIDITVAKHGPMNDAIAINIGTHSMDGKNFFQQNSKDLFSHLSNAGLNVADMKVEIPSQTAKNDFDMSQHNKGQQQGSERQFGSEQNQRRHDSQRREDLWKLLNKEAA